MSTHSPNIPIVGNVFLAARTFWSWTRRIAGTMFLVLLVAATVVISAVILKLVVWPGYVNPQSRMYTSKLGYAALLRHQGLPFPVRTAQPAERLIVQRFTGEGFVRAQPILVPLVPVARVLAVHAEVGNEVRKGDLLVELDRTQAELRLEAAKVAFFVAKAELARTRLGTSYVLRQEQPEHDAIAAHAVKEQAAIKKELDRRAEELFEKRLISREELLNRKLDNVRVSAEVEKAEVSLRNSQQGHRQSIQIAEAELRAAYLAYKQREAELAEYNVYAPADGIVERKLIHEGEFNQEPGRPAFLLATGKWFEAYFDQTVTGLIREGDRGQIQLEAFAGVELPAKVTTVHPFVSFSASGPEVNRPIRPSGTGAPEWPTTFPVRFELPPIQLPVNVGLSGFARVESRKRCLCIPDSAVVSRLAGRGYVYVPVGDQFEKRPVVLGGSSDGWTEIVEGLSTSDSIIVEGQHVLIEGDRIQTADDCAATLGLEPSEPEDGGE